ncbi:VWA domain-containing protein [Streptosporangium sp. NPDC051023]|uniref:vWA domain-containing protein n=1 Tax=Streptosporangium sp. NPDC051023 TaxID=3155410 RepID=UPI003450ACE7
MSLLDRHVGFVHALRQAGLPVSPAEGLDAARALGMIDLTEREWLRAAYASTLVKRPSHRPGFDILFDLWFPTSTTGLYGRRDEDHPAPGEGTTPEKEGVPGFTPETAGIPELRDRLAGLLLGTEATTRTDEFARAMVERFGRQSAGPGRQSWFSYPVLRALSPETLMARLLAEVLEGRERGGLAEKVARQRISANTRRFEEAVATDVRRRIAEESGIERIARSAVRPPLERVDFLGATRDDLARLRREVYPLARRLATRLTVKHRLGHRGRLDFRRTVRASLSSGGVPLSTFNRPRRPHRPELVVLCDASDSVASFAHFTLLLTYALREQFARVRAFGFVDTVDEITRFFAPGADVAESITRLAKEADMVRFGRTNYGYALERFAERHGDAVGPKTSLLILGDARSNYQPPALETLRQLSLRARHSHWLNPEPRKQWDTGDSLATAYGGIVPMYECRNVAQLAAFVERLA